MRKVYIITCTVRANKFCEFTLSNVEFAFTSKKMAHRQLDIIKDKIENGGWWADYDRKPLLGKVLSDTRCEDNFRSILRDVLVETPNGLKEIYRLQERDLNSGIYLTD